MVCNIMGERERYTKFYISLSSYIQLFNHSNQASHYILSSFTNTQQSNERKPHKKLK